MKVQALISNWEELWITQKQVPELVSYYSASNLFAIFNKSGIWWIIVDRSCLLHCFSQNCNKKARHSICLGGPTNFLMFFYTWFLKSTKELLISSLIQNCLLIALETRNLLNSSLVLLQGTVWRALCPIGLYVDPNPAFS